MVFYVLLPLPLGEVVSSPQARRRRGRLGAEGIFFLSVRQAPATFCCPPFLSRNGEKEDQGSALDPFEAGGILLGLRLVLPGLRPSQPGEIPCAPTGWARGDVEWSPYTTVNVAEKIRIG